MGWVIGDQFQFNNEPIKFFQDFSFWLGTIPDVWLRLTSFEHNNTYAWLQGDGYGEHSSYGNGAICVAIEELYKCSSHRPYILRTWEQHIKAPKHPDRLVVEL